MNFLTGKLIFLAAVIGWAGIVYLIKGIPQLESPHGLLEKLLVGSASLLVSMLTYTGIKEIKARRQSRKKEEQKQSKKQKSKNKNKRNYP